MKGGIPVPAVFEKLDRLKPIYDAAYRVTMVVCKLLLIADVMITSVAVLGRYVSFIPDPAWSEEIVLTCMAYMAVLSASLALRRNSHIRMTALDPYLPKTMVRIMDLIADAAVFAFALIMITAGWRYCVGLGSKGYYTSIPTLSKFWLYFPVPLAGVVMVIFELEILYNHIKIFFIKEDEGK